MEISAYPDHRGEHCAKECVTFQTTGRNMRFRKYHALGNDYTVIDPGLSRFTPEPSEIKKLCDRHTGIGSDGILFGPLFHGRIMGVRIFNPDGSEAEKSGNGVRIFARYCADMRYIEKNPFSLRTLGGDVRVRFLKGKEQMVCVDMGKATFQSNDIPVSGKAREVVDETVRVD